MKQQESVKNHLTRLLLAATMSIVPCLGLAGPLTIDSLYRSVTGVNKLLGSDSTKSSSFGEFSAIAMGDDAYNSARQNSNFFADDYVLSFSGNALAEANPEDGGTALLLRSEVILNFTLESDAEYTISSYIESSDPYNWISNVSLRNLNDLSNLIYVNDSSQFGEIPFNPPPLVGTLAAGSYVFRSNLSTNPFLDGAGISQWFSDFEVRAIPEPGTLQMLIAGMLLLVFRQRFGNARRSPVNG